MNDSEEPWRTLGIAPTRDQVEIRRAYAKKLKLTNPEDDAEGFQQLRGSYEFARQLASYVDTNDDSLPGDEIPFESIIPAAPITPPEPARPDDPAGIALDAALAELGQELRSETPVAAERLEQLLDAVLACDFERFDLLQRAEQQLLDLLAANSPRSDPLLSAADRRFEWSARKEDRTLPMEARQVLSRLAELQTVEALRNGDSEESRAYARLSAPSHPQMRFVRAYLPYTGSTPPEAALIRRLQIESPSILSSLDPENIAWWTRYLERPHFSVLTLLVALIPSFIIVMIARHAVVPPDAVRDIPASYLAAWTAVLSIGIALARLYVIEWPVVLAEQRWPWGKPLWFAYGWLPALALLLVAGAFAMAQPWISITIAALMCLLAWWSVIAAGPVEPLFAGTGERLWVQNSRLVRIALANIASGIWFLTILSEYTVPWPVTLTVVAAMCASGVDRQSQIQGFVSHLVRWQRLTYLGALVVVAIALGVTVFNFAGFARWQLPLFVGVICVVILRRPVALAVNIPVGGGQMVWLASIIGFRLLHTLADRSVSPDPHSDANGGIIVIGSILMLSGVVIAALAAIGPNRR